MHDLQSAYEAGSPPRAWGQCSGLGARSRVSRFTPTGVGTMTQAWCWFVNYTVHPHGRGDNYSPHVRAITKTVHPHGRGDNLGIQPAGRQHVGSPPRAWGQWWWSPEYGARHRFTPTGVGTMTARAGLMLMMTVHPHGRGDNRLLARARTAICGSPPRAWGQSFG